MKKVTIAIEVDDDFVPPEEFHNGTGNYVVNPCASCPFYHWSDEYGDAVCSYLNDDRGECPIKKYFK